MDEILAREPRNASALLVKGLVEYQRGHVHQAFELARQAEDIRPKTEYHCWVALQMALLAGDMTSIRKECRHLDGHERFRDRARYVAAEVARRSVT